MPERGRPAGLLDGDEQGPQARVADRAHVERERAQAVAAVAAQAGGDQRDAVVADGAVHAEVEVAEGGVGGQRSPERRARLHADRAALQPQVVQGPVGQQGLGQRPPRIINHARLTTLADGISADVERLQQQR